MTHTVRPSRRQLLLGTAVAALATPALMTGASAAPPWKTGFDTAGIDTALSAMIRDGAVGVTASVVGPRGAYTRAVGVRDQQKSDAALDKGQDLANDKFAGHDDKIQKGRDALDDRLGDK